MSAASGSIWFYYENEEHDSGSNIRCTPIPEPEMIYKIRVKTTWQLGANTLQLHG
jgi:hypothetical protein